MATVNQKVRSGNKTVVVVDGKVVGLVQNMRGSDDYSPEPASGLGDIHPVEHVPTTARHTVTMSQMSLINGNLRKIGISMENGDAVLRGNVFDIVVMSKDGEALRKYSGCTYASGDIEVTAHKILVSNATFLALDVSGKGL